MRSMRAARRIALTAIGFAGVAWAHAEAGSQGAEDAQFWSATATGEGDSRGGYSAMTHLRYSPSARMSWAVSLSRSASQAGLTGMEGVLTNAAAVMGTYEGERGGISVEGRAFRERDLLTAREVSLGLKARWAEWYATLHGTYRNADFDTFDSNGILQLADGSVATVSGAASCTSDDYGYGPEVGFAGERWQIFLKALRFADPTTTCDITSLSNSTGSTAVTGRGAPNAGLVRHPDVGTFRQLANPLVSTLAQSADLRPGLLDNSFLSDEIATGASYVAEATIWGLDYERGREQFDRRVLSAVTASLDVSVSHAADVQLWLGGTERASSRSAAFLGAAYTIRF